MNCGCNSGILLVEDSKSCHPASFALPKDLWWLGRLISRSWRIYLCDKEFTSKSDPPHRTSPGFWRWPIIWCSRWCLGFPLTTCPESASYGPYSGNSIGTAFHKGHHRQKWNHHPCSSWHGCGCSTMCPTSPSSTPFISLVWKCHPVNFIKFFSER
jgi:hypothetical protein